MLNKTWALALVLALAVAPVSSLLAAGTPKAPHLRIHTINTNR